VNLSSATTSSPTLHTRSPGQVLKGRVRRNRIISVILLTILLLSTLLSIGMGGVSITPLQVFSIFLDRLGIESPWQYTNQQEMVLFAIRLPRVLLAILVGAGLSVSGAIMQGLFRNPLADPGLVGVSSGAAVFAVATIVFGTTLLGGISSLLGTYMIPFAAFLGSMVVIFTVYRLSTWQGQTSVATMLLAGIALSAIAAAGMGLMILIADESQLRDITFWTLGSLGGATWTTLLIVSPFILLGLLGSLRLARPLNTILLGESAATHLGIQTEPLKRKVILITGLTVGAAVAVTGIINFVGLVVPHLVRLTIGPDHRTLIPGSALLGASLMLLADLISRTIISPAELPIGLVTALIGAPFFLWLLLQFRQKAGLGF